MKQRHAYKHCPFRIHAWLDSLRKNVDAMQVDTIVLDPREDHRLVRVLRHLPEWLLDFHSPEARIYVRAAQPVSRSCPRRAM